MSVEQKIVYIVLIYLVVINLVTFFVYGIDKWKAKRAKWRIEESTLLWWAAAGGSIGALLGMKAWHHKTQHRKFTWGLPAILIAQLAILGILIYYFYPISSHSMVLFEQIQAKKYQATQKSNDKKTNNHETIILYLSSGMHGCECVGRGT